MGHHLIKKLKKPNKNTIKLKKPNKYLFGFFSFIFTLRLEKNN